MSSVIVNLVLLSVCFLLASRSVPVSAASASAMNLPSDVDILQDEGDSPEANWLETRDLTGDFKNLVYLAIKELAYEGRLNPGAISRKPNEMTKRGRHQGFCFKRTRSGRFLPYICWKENDSSK